MLQHVPQQNWFQEVYLIRQETNIPKEIIGRFRFESVLSSFSAVRPQKGENFLRLFEPYKWKNVQSVAMVDAASVKKIIVHDSDRTVDIPVS